MKITYSNLIAKTSWHTYWKFRMKSKIFILVFEMKVWYYRSQARRYKHVTLFLIIKQYTLYLIKQKVHIAASLSILTSLFAKKLQNASTRITAYICGISTLTCEVMPASYNWFWLIRNYCEVHQKATFIFDKVARNSKNALADQSQR